MAEPARGFVSSNGINLAYLEWGGGDRNLVLLHGWTGWGRQWQRVAEALPEFHSYAPDQRGHGDSSQPDTGYHLFDYVADVHSLIHALGIVGTALVGHSWGGAVGLCLAATHRGDLSRLVAEDPVLTWRLRNAETESLPNILRRKTQSRDDVMADLLTIDPTATAEDLEQRCAAYQRFSADALRQTLTASRDIAFEEIVPRITCPTLLLVGEVARGGCVPAAERERIGGLLPGCRVQYFADVGHTLHRSAFDRYIAALRQFLLA